MTPTVKRAASLEQSGPYRPTLRARIPCSTTFIWKVEWWWPTACAIRTAPPSSPLVAQDEVDPKLDARLRKTLPALCSRRVCRGFCDFDGSGIQIREA